MKNEDILSFLPLPKIVAVDNDANELKIITKGLRGLGLPVLPVDYDMVAGLDLPETGKFGRMRVLFLDLNLNDFENPAGSISPVAVLLMEVLKALSPHGPYIIGFWTKHPTLVNKIMAHIIEKDVKKEIPLPIRYETINKTPFLDGVNNPEELKKEIIDFLLKHKLFLSLLAWESEIEKASGQTLNTISSLVKNPQKNGTSLAEKDIVDILRSLAKEAFGKDRAKENPGRAVTKGLAPLLFDHIDRIPANTGYLDIWKETLNTGWNRSLPRNVSPAALNSYCIVDLNNHALDLRGVWYEFTETAFRKHAFWKRYFGTDKATLRKEFINPPVGGKEKDILNSVKLGILECTAACDFMNGKVPLKRFVLCAMVPSAYRNYIFWKNPDRKLKHGAIHSVKSIMFYETEHDLFLNFKFSVSLPSDNGILTPEYTKTLFRIRNQALNDISTKFANHTTRPGFFSL